MARRLHNWNYRDVTDFLKSRGFSFYKELGGSHQAWIKRECNGAPKKVVELNFTHRTYPLKTLKTMISQTGISEKEWILWTRSDRKSKAQLEKGDAPLANEFPGES
jgi:hypothetical protein